MADAASAPLSCDLNAAGLTPEATAYVVHIAFALLLVLTLVERFDIEPFPDFSAK